MYSSDFENSLVTVKKMGIDEKISFWQWVMEYAKKRCIQAVSYTHLMEADPEWVENFLANYQDK